MKSLKNIFMAYCDNFVYASVKSSSKIQQRLSASYLRVFGFLELKLPKRQKFEHQAEIFCYFFCGKKSKARKIIRRSRKTAISQLLVSLVGEILSREAKNA